ncbi:hypothetical protein CP061683_0620B, partial [Chlamydia psittaci 06-1683]
DMKAAIDLMRQLT